MRKMKLLLALIALIEAAILHAEIHTPTLDGLHSSNPLEQVQSAQKLGEDFKDTELVIKSLVDLLGDDTIYFNTENPEWKGYTRHVSDHAVAALIKIGKPAMPYLQEALGSKNELKRLGVVTVIGGINDDTVLTKLKELSATDPSRAVRFACELTYNGIIESGKSKGETPH